MSELYTPRSPSEMSLPTAKKRFGQNFLHDANVIARILRVIGPQPGDSLVEIGPGPGALTAPMLALVPQLTVIELDRDIIPYLRYNCGSASERLTVLQADALTVDYATLATPGCRLRLVGNLPYNISTPLIFHLLQFACVADMHFMLQKEVVNRLCADPDDDDYGRLTATVAARADCQKLLHVGPGSFTPAPKVDSAIVRLTPRPAQFELASLALYDKVVTAAFSQRRKTLSNSLKSLLSASEIQQAGINPQARAETLSPAQFGQLSLVLARQGV